VYGKREDRRTGAPTGVGSELSRTGHRTTHPHHAPTGVLLLDIVYVIGILAVFALVGLVARGVEKL